MISKSIGGILCRLCDTWKPADEFDISKSCKIGRRFTCKVCDKGLHGENNKRVSREYYHANKEKCNKATQAWQTENKDKLRLTQKYWIAHRYNHDEIYKKAHLIRTRTNKAYKVFLDSGVHMVSRNGDMDYEAIFEHLGECPGEYGRGSGLMTFDHIIGLRLLDLTDPIEWKIAVHPRNIRWMLWEDNYQRDRGWTQEILELYRELHKEVAPVETKKCARCKETKELTKENFPIHKQTYCRICDRAMAREYYNKDKEKHKIRKRKQHLAYYVANGKRLVKYIKEVGGCEDCGDVDLPVYCYDFHHLKPEEKKFSISEKMGRAPWTTLAKEIKKCALLCCNCHRKRTAVANNYHWYLEEDDEDC